MINCSIHDQKVLEDINFLIANNIRERKDIEYKREYNIQDPVNTILKPICALANTTNGFVIYGIDEKSPEELELCGISIQDIDKTKLRIENLVRDCIEPRYAGIDMAFHPLPDTDKYIGIISVKKSLAGPHRDSKSYKFYSRNSAGSYSMDINEIRNSFLFSAHITERVNNFIQNRIKAIQSKSWPVPLAQGASVIIHIIPVSSLMSGEKCTALQLNEFKTQLKPEYSNFRYDSWENRIILEGLLGLCRHQQKFNRYDLIWREGIIESVSIFPPMVEYNGESLAFLPAEYYERMVINDIRRFLRILKGLKQDTPFIIGISYLQLNNYSLGVGNHKLYSFDRDSFQLSSEIIDTYDVDITKIVKPLFDCVWNCCGLLECATDLKSV